MTEQASSATAPVQQGDTPTQTAPDTTKSQKFKVKIDGHESEVPIEELINDYQSKVVSTKRFMQASQIRKEVDELVSGLSKADKGAVQKLLKAVGPESFKKIAEDFLIEQIQYDSLPESDRKRIEAERKAKTLEDQLKHRDKERENIMRSQIRQQAIQDIDTEINEVLQSSKLKAKPRFVARIVETMLANLESKGAKLPAKNAYDRAFKDLEADLHEYIPTLDLEALKKILTKEQLKSLRMADVEAARSQFSSRSSTPKQEAQPRSKKKMSLDEWFSKKERQFGD